MFCVGTKGAEAEMITQMGHSTQIRHNMGLIASLEYESFSYVFYFLRLLAARLSSFKPVSSVVS